MNVLTTVLLFSLFAAIQALSSDEITKLKGYYDDCVKSTNVNVELILKARKGEFSSDANLQKYFFCMFNKIGIINENGSVQIDVIRDKIPADVNKEDAEKIIAACKDKIGKDKYDTAREIYECYYTLSPKHIVFA
ncbi:hypothetical protein RN001_002112 [Aquatica leii]|uniref:Uncharacterized protein n=1 Tax=Aquatica leii TaxID=1421715 RepID=A0AAN7SD32_9COLE|nr:hypothetical protein RN001_002112 [Aquatica leii]